MAANESTSDAIYKDEPIQVQEGESIEAYIGNRIVYILARDRRVVTVEVIPMDHVPKVIRRWYADHCKQIDQHG